MTQILVLIGAVLALIGSIGMVYQKGGDARESDVRAEYARAAKLDKERRESQEEALRQWALQISRNYLAFSSSQEKFFTGVRNDLTQQIANDPALRRDCFDALGVSRFNGQPAASGGPGTGATSGGSDGAVRRGTPAPAR